MSRFIKDNKGIMGLTLSQIGLIIATGILLAAIFSLIFINDWQINAELKNIVTSFSTMVEGMDTRFFEDTISLRFPNKGYYYNLSISAEYIVVRAQGNWNNELSVKERFLVRPWPQSKGSPWIGRTGLHNYLESVYLHSGNISDPIQTQDASNVKNDLSNKWKDAAESLAKYPLYLLTNKTVYIDKAYVYYENGEKQDFIFVYQ